MYFSEGGVLMDSGNTTEFHEAVLLLHELERQKKSVQKQFECGIINSIGVSEEIMNINKKEFALKEKLVNQAHVTSKGEPRTIKYSESKGLWKTVLAEKKELYGKSREILIEKLFDYYGLKLTDSSLKSIFELAIKEKHITENNNEGTISRYYSDFERYITPEFAQKDIRSLTKADMKAYTQALVNRMMLKKSAFLAYKGVLNLIFDYALEYDIINSNPLPAIHNRNYYKSCDMSKAKPEDKILSPNEIDVLKAEIRHRMGFKKYNGYFINGYCILFAIETGMRAAELCSIKWSDIDYNRRVIHIHTQQLYIITDKDIDSYNGKPVSQNTNRSIDLSGKKNRKLYYLSDSTKDEKGISRGGREFPLTDSIISILKELKDIQGDKGIHSEYIFCHEDGEWIKTDAYETCLRRICQKLGFNVTNNHALRMSLNSNILIPLGIPVTERARMLGHSVETNLRYYSFAGTDSNADLLGILNGSHPGPTLKGIS